MQCRRPSLPRLQQHLRMQKAAIRRMKTKHPAKIYGQRLKMYSWYFRFFSASDTGECCICDEGRIAHLGSLVVSCPFNRTWTKSCLAFCMSVVDKSCIKGLPPDEEPLQPPKSRRAYAFRTGAKISICAQRGTDYSYKSSCQGSCHNGQAC